MTTKQSNLEKAYDLLKEAEALISPEPYYYELDELQTLKDRVEAIDNTLYDHIDTLEDYIITTEREAIESYDEMLDECYPMAEGWQGTVSQAMKDNDEVMYRCGFNDWMDSMRDELPKEAEDWSV